jgi:cell division protein FtsZ
MKVTKATQYIYDNTHPEVNIILGTVIDKELGDKVRATIIATDFIDGTVIQSANMEVPQSKLSAQSNLEPPHFLNNKAGEVPEFKHGSFSIPSFQRPDEKKK